MTYRTEQILRILALVGMLAFAVSSVSGWSYGILLGFMLWLLLLPFTIGGFLAGLVPTDLRSLWIFTRPREERVPRLAIDFAKRLNARPPKVMKVLPGNHMHAAVDSNTLYVTEGLRARLWTQMAEGVIAHEMGHLAGKHSLKMSVTSYFSVLLIIVTVALIGESSWAIPIAVALTIFPVSLPLFSRRMEYNADRHAASVVGMETMSHTLRTIVDRPQWSKESDTHPSIERRLARLRKVEGRSFRRS